MAVISLPFPVTSVAVLVLLLLNVPSAQLACANSGDCHREGCDDSHAMAPRNCHDHFNEMNCFRVCKDPAELLQCFKEREHNRTQEYCVLKYSRDLHDAQEASNVASASGTNLTKTSHPGLPCDIKCRVDPVFWACVHQCDAKGCFKTFKECENKLVNETVNNTLTGRQVIACDTTAPNFMNTSMCSQCYVHDILKEMDEHDECIFRYSTIASPLIVSGPDSAAKTARLSQLSQCTYLLRKSWGNPNVTNDTAAHVDITFCINDVIQNLNATTEDMEKCYRTRLMHRQVNLCLMAVYTPECPDGASQKTANCQDRCLIALTKPFCYLPCPRNQALKACKADCLRKHPILNCDDCKNQPQFYQFMKDVGTRKINYLNRVASNCTTRTPTCYLEQIYNENRPSAPGTTGVSGWETPDVVKNRNCKSIRHIHNFANKLIQRKSGNSSFASDFSVNLVEHYTFRECYLTECQRRSETDAQHCSGDCVRKSLTQEDLDYACSGTSNLPPSPSTVIRVPTGKHTAFRAEILIWCMVHLNANKKWSIQDYYRTVREQDNSYMELYTCEKDIREDDIGSKYTTAFVGEVGTVAEIVYEMERDWCQECKDVSSADGKYHSYDLTHAKCEYENCYLNELPNTCRPLKPLNAVVRAAVATQCYWRMDYSLSPEPYTIWSTYFDEIPPHDETSNLIKPNTQKYLLKSSLGASKGYYIFPYFLVIRPFCEDGFYDDAIYKFIASGGKPQVLIKYVAQTSRQKYVDYVKASFQGALVNLERKTTSDKIYIQMNPLNKVKRDGKTGCHLKLCYPAFLVPQILLHIPIFEVTVKNQQTISHAHTLGYTTTLHLRDVSGEGSLKIADKQFPPTADEFFPVRKIQVYEDTQFVHLWDRLPDSGYTGHQGPPGPELEHLTDENCKPYPNADSIVGGNPHFPLDSEDFFSVQYTHGNAPQAIIAGFYDPNLVIIGDPDMKRHELVRWQFEVTSGSEGKPSPHLFHSGYPCFSQNFKVKHNAKPMYSLFDRLDPDYWIEFYRMRYAPKNYTNVSSAKAIFTAITLEDRVLFVTTSGIVTFYQNYNTTSGLGKAWEVEPADRLKKCFKLVRVAKRAHPKGDTIVAITYDYQVFDTNKNATFDISQQVWVGTYQGNAQPIKWQEITSGLTSENLKEERAFNLAEDELGGTGPLPEQKLMGIPIERRETNPKSQIEAICYKTYRSNMGKASYIELIEDQGWCDAIDATPVAAVDQKIQVLVRMKAYYSGGTKSSGKQKPRIVVFYVIASFSTDKSASQSSIWQINAIIPRIPCQDEHKESIPSVVQYTQKYFKSGKPDQVKGDYGCHSEEENRKDENKIFLHGMTYTRSYNHHLFLFGNTLLQSTDGGETFVQLDSFPEKGTEYDCHDSGLIYHRIKVMAFDDLGHYAFLTSKRELWYGNLGSLHQIRLRPSKAYSMILTRLPEIHELSEAVPFTVFFDSSNDLVEMVAVVNHNGTVSRIGRRSINEKTILRARYFIEQILKSGDQQFVKLEEQYATVLRGSSTQEREFKAEHLESIDYVPLKWSVFCPFASPSFSHNFSELHGRQQFFFFPAPKQHAKLGDVYNPTTLYTYQAIAFNLIWNSFFNYPYRSYSFVTTDPFILWNQKKETDAVLGRLTYLSSDPQAHGIMVATDKYRRYKTSVWESKIIFSTYYMDYGISMELVIEYSISNDYTLNPIDYLNHHLESILLNVDNANGSLIQINTEKEVLAPRAAVRYVIIISVKKYTGLPQSYSGRDAIQVPVKLHLIGGFGNCIPTDTAGILGDSIATVIQVGCPPSLDLVFDWESTLDSIKFRDVEAHFGKESHDCYKSEDFCFFARYPLILHFHVFDNARQRHYNFTGKYIMRIIAGGYSRDSMVSYTPEEQQAFNIPGVSDVSLIWNEWDRKFHQKVQRDSSYVTTSGRNDSREIVLQAGKSSIQWGCHTLSPCARISPRSGLETVYYFKIFITNRGVDNDTLCLFEKEFIILLYGFPPSPEIQLITSVVFYVLILSVFYIAYFCMRGHKKLWRSTTLKLYGWFQVIKETLPKHWFKSTEEDQEETELEAQRRKDDIILSLQGHLNVPKLVPKSTKATSAPAREGRGEDDDEDEEDEERIQNLNVADAHPSLSSFVSASSDTESKRYVIDPVTARPGPTTWTDLIYEQIISRRLVAILERNRKKAEELKEKGENK